MKRFLLAAFALLFAGCASPAPPTPRQPERVSDSAPRGGVAPSQAPEPLVFYEDSDTGRWYQLREDAEDWPPGLPLIRVW